MARRSEAHSNPDQSYPMPSQDDAARWKRLAVEVRERASEMNGNGARTTMVNIACASERLALRAGERANGAMSWMDKARALLRQAGQDQESGATGKITSSVRSE